MQGFLFAGLQYASHCFCGNEYDRYGAYDNCNMACAGDGNKICGGGWANQVYRIGKFHAIKDIALSSLKNVCKDAYTIHF